MAHAPPMEEDELAHHPSPRQYVAVGIFLGIVTAAEVAIYYFNFPDWLLVVGLAVFAVIKFVMVVMWFMHLRFDSRLFRRLFVTGLVTAMLVFAAVLATFLLREGPAPTIVGG